MTCMFRPALSIFSIVAVLIGSFCIESSAVGQEASTEQVAEESLASEQSSEQGRLRAAMQSFDDALAKFNNLISGALFFTVPMKYIDVEPSEEYPDGRQAVGLPFIVVVLALGGIFFTLRYYFVNVWLFPHSIQVIRGKYDAPDHAGEISHFQALTSALSATVGLGNIAGVAVAISLGGPGAVFWMWVIAFFGMSMKFSSCTFAQLFRRIDPDGRTLGGPMVYLEEGLKPIIGWPVSKVLGCVYAVMCILASFGGGNLFQGNQTAAALIHTLGGSDQSYEGKIAIGLSLAILAGIVIIGGIRRIGEVTSRVVPLMCLFYVGVCLFTILTNLDKAGDMFRSIFTEAFSGNAIGGAAAGGLILVFRHGAQRAVFSNEAGVGSAAIAHSAARTDEPIREGVVAMIGPFVDTILICTMTALTLLITNVFGGEFGQNLGFADGAIKTIEAFGTVHRSLSYALCVAIFVFAYSTIISWSYYGDRATEYLFGRTGIWPYRIVFVVCVALGPLFSLENVINFSDIALLSMAFPNIIGMVILSGTVVKLLKDYSGRLKSGEIRPYS